MSQPKKDNKARTRRMRTWGILLGVVLAVACNSVPEDYQTACRAVAELAAYGGCGG